MEINYELEAKDLIAYHKHAAKDERMHKTMVRIYSFVLGTFILADFIYAIFLGWADVWSFKSFLLHLAIRILICAALVGFILLVTHLIQLRLGKRVADFEQNGVLCPHKMVLNEKELIEITNVNTSRHAWASIAEIEETEKLLLITISSSATFIIPKRYFRDSEHIKNFLETANYYRENASHTFQLSYLTEYEKSLR